MLSVEKKSFYQAILGAIVSGLASVLKFTEWESKATQHHDAYMALERFFKKAESVTYGGSGLDLGTIHTMVDDMKKDAWPEVFIDYSNQEQVFVHAEEVLQKHGWRFCA